MGIEYMTRQNGGRIAHGRGRAPAGGMETAL